MVITPQDLQSPTARKPTFDHMVQVRFTAAQYQLLRTLTEGTCQPLSAVVRGVIVCWATNHLNESAALADEADVVDVQAMVDELNALMGEQA